MKRKDIDLSRRKVLAGIGAAGVASVGAGMGTSAYFSDVESFEGNTIAAGELDLKVDWQQTYNGPNPGNDGVVETHPVNAYPDTPVSGQQYGDGLQDLDGVRYSGAGEVEPVFDAADVPACCDCGPDEYYLTYGGETYCIEPLSGDLSVEEFYNYDDSSGVYSSLNDGIQRADTTFVFLYEDGDGELSLVIVNDDRENEDGGSAASVTIEGAPSGVGWIAGGTTGDDNWVVKDDQEGNTDSGFDQYETAEANWVWTNNRTDGGAIGTLADDFALRLSASLNDAADLSGSNARGNGQIEEFVVLSGGSGLGAGSQEISLETGIGESEDNEVGPITIHSACGIDSGSQLNTPAVFQSENYPDQERLIELDDVKPGDSGEITFSLHLCDNPGYIWLTASNFTDGPGETPEPEPTPDDGELAANTMVRIWYDEDCDNEHDDEEVLVFGPGVGGYTDFDGGNPATLAAAMGVIGAGPDSGGMIPLDGDTSSPMDYDDGPTANSRDCLPGETGMCVGVEWWVPTKVANEIQGDSVGFDLGFYTEQCRHNDGSGSSNGGNDDNGAAT